MIGEQLVADVVEVADQRHVDAALVEAFADVRHGRRGFVAVDRDAHELGAGAGKRCHLRDRALHVGGIGIGHRLHDDRRTAADLHAADDHRHADAARARAGNIHVGGDIRDLVHRRFLGAV